MLRSRMRKLILILALFLTSPVFAEVQANYILTIDGVEYPIALDGSMQAKTKTGEELSIQLKRKEFATYSDGPVSFEHKADTQVGTKDIDEETRQHLAVTATGTMILLQTYKSTVPSEVVELMVKSLTEEDVAAGAKMEQSEFTRTLADGTVLKGVRATIKAAEDDGVLNVMAYDAEEGGVLAITNIDVFTSPEDQPMIDKFWATLKVKP